MSVSLECLFGLKKRLKYHKFVCKLNVHTSTHIVCNWLHIRHARTLCVTASVQAKSSGLADFVMPEEEQQKCKNDILKDLAVGLRICEMKEKATDRCAEKETH